MIGDDTYCKPLVDESTDDTDSRSQESDHNFKRYRRTWISPKRDHRNSSIRNSKIGQMIRQGSSKCDFRGDKRATYTSRNFVSRSQLVAETYRTARHMRRQLNEQKHIVRQALSILSHQKTAARRASQVIHLVEQYVPNTAYGANHLHHEVTEVANLQSYLVEQGSMLLTQQHSANRYLKIAVENQQVFIDKLQ